ncbi:MAG: CotH kinase family protein [Saprospiraceae bacterium]|nr:CotH kinase family protein [Saprospiraceae bacterium]
MHSQVNNPIFSSTSTISDSILTLNISSLPGSSIYYTIDGSEPNRSSNLYSGSLTLGPLNDKPNVISQIPTNNVGPGNPYREEWRPPASSIQKLHVIRARAYDIQGDSSDITSGTYLIHPDGQNRYSMPLVSLITEADNLFGEEKGIYVPGASGENYNMTGDQWERPVFIELIEKDGSLAISQNGGVRINGGTSRNRPRKALRLYAKSEYGPSWFDTQLFPDKNVGRYKRFLLRNGGNDWSETLFRDVYLQKLVKRNTDLDIQYSRPAVVFINGEYWGIHNFRDRFDDRYLEAHYNVDPERITIISQNGNLEDGNEEGVDDYWEMFNHVSKQNMLNSTMYNRAKELMDIDNFIDYQVLNIFARNTDWPGNNTECWKYLDGTLSPGSSHPTDGRWRWLVFDMDFGFGLNFDYVRNSASKYGENNAFHQTLEFALEPNGPGWPNPQWSTAMLRNLMKNPQFKSDFISRFADHLNSTFHKDRLLSLLDSLKNQYEPEMAEHIDRWREPQMAYWQGQVNVMKTFALLRTELMRIQLNNYFDVGGRDTITLDVEQTALGKIKVNTILLDSNTDGVSEDTYPWKGVYFNNLPVRVIAVPNPGYEFVRWEGDLVSAEDTLIVDLKLVKNLTAIFSDGFVFEGDSMNPAAFKLRENNFFFGDWSSTIPEDSFPSHMVFLQSSVNDPRLETPMTNPYYIPFNNASDNEYHADDQDKFGFPYMLTGRTRLSGLGEEGISLINTGRGRDLGSVVLALDTRGVVAARIGFVAGTLLANSRVYHIRLQYRTGLNESWKDVLNDAGNLIEYERTANPSPQTFEDINLPEEALDKSYVQLQWKYYFTGTQITQESGQRDMLRLDDISVIGTSTGIKENVPKIQASLFPNPNTGIFYVQISQAIAGPILLQLMDTQGKVVHSQIIEGPIKANSQLKLKSITLKPGIYYCKVSNNLELISIPVVILR